VVNGLLRPATAGLQLASSTRKLPGFSTTVQGAGKRRRGDRWREIADVKLILCRFSH
jgi:hypothetical protein